MNITIVYFLWAMLLGESNAGRSNISSHSNIIECELALREMAPGTNAVWGCDGWTVHWDQYNEHIVGVVRVAE